MQEVLFQNVDCVHLRVTSPEEGLDFYRDGLALKLLWRTETACGLGTKNGFTEIVLSTEDFLTVDMRVKNVRQALQVFTAVGGKLEGEPFGIDIGECAVVTDPFGNKYCILDDTNGTYDTTEGGLVGGVSKKA